MSYLPDNNFLKLQNDLLPDERPPLLISEYVENRRVLPPSSPFPGLWNNRVTPYMIEPINNLSPYSPVQITAMMKARKIGASTCFENAIAYYMDAVPSEILYSTATEALAKDWSKKKISHVIDSLGFRHKLISADNNAKSRATGDRMFCKEFIGGSLDIIAATSGMAKRALDKRVLIIDEVDGVAPLTTTGEGQWTDILIAHTDCWNERRKVGLFSSPTTDEESLISVYYEKGDKRAFLIPCPICGKDIELKFGDHSTKWGLKWETKAGLLIDAYYVCEYCGDAFFNEEKDNFYSLNPKCKKHPEKELKLAHWEATRPTGDPTYRSYQINSLYSPNGMYSFTSVAKDWIEKEEQGADGMRSFINIRMGLPYKEETTRPSLKKTLEHRGAYSRGKVPPGVLFLTMACDVQRGSANNINNPARIECEIMGTGLGYKTWSIDYKVFKGSLNDPYDGAWEEMYQWIKSINGTFYSESGIGYQIKMIGIDCGDAEDGRAEKVYRFCERWSPFAYPVKGFAQLKARKNEKADIPGAASFKKYRAAKIGTGGEYVLEISTVYYKDTLYGRLNIEASADNPHPNGYCDFPADYSDEYFRQLTNSEKITGGGYKDIKPCEALDCRVYNLCLSDAWLESQVKNIRDEALRKGADSTWVQMTINSRTVLDHLQAQLSAYGAKTD